MVMFTNMKRKPYYVLAFVLLRFVDLKKKTKNRSASNNKEAEQGCLLQTPNTPVPWEVIRFFRL